MFVELTYKILEEKGFFSLKVFNYFCKPTIITHCRLSKMDLNSEWVRYYLKFKKSAFVALLGLREYNKPMNNFVISKNILTGVLHV